MKLKLSHDGEEQITSADSLEKKLATLGHTNNFAILEGAEGFIQTAHEINMTFVIEYQNSNGEHFIATRNNFTLNEVQEIFKNYFLGSPIWKLLGSSP